MRHQKIVGRLPLWKLMGMDGNWWELMGGMDGNGREWMGMDGMDENAWWHGWEWMDRMGTDGMNGNGWEQMGMDGNWWKWMEIDGNWWVTWMGMDGNGRHGWVNAQATYGSMHGQSIQKFEYLPSDTDVHNACMCLCVGEQPKLWYNKWFFKKITAQLPRGNGASSMVHPDTPTLIYRLFQLVLCALCLCVVTKNDWWKIEHVVF